MVLANTPVAAQELELSLKLVHHSISLLHHKCIWSETQMLALVYNANPIKLSLQIHCSAIPLVSQAALKAWCVSACAMHHQRTLSIDDTHFWICNCKKNKFTHSVSRKYSYCLHVWWVWKNLLCGLHRTWRLCNVTGFTNSFESLICCSLYSARGGSTYYGTLILPSWKRQNMLAKLLRGTRAEFSAGHQQLQFYSPVWLSSPANPTQPIYTCINRQNVNNVGNLKSKSSHGSLLQISIQTFLIFLIEEMMMMTMFFFSFTINNIDLLQWNAGANL